MKAQKPKESSRQVLGLGRTVYEDLRRGGHGKTIRRDLNDLYRFYIDEEHRSRLSRMSPFRRYILIAFWLLKNMILKLTPTRRILLLICFIFFLYGGISFRMGEARIVFHMGAFSFFILLIILMLELKDKLLARDELIAGRTVQLALLPETNPSLPGWEIWLYTRAANDVGGDLIDYIAMSDGRLGISVGDVSGKGLGAALLMAKLQATLRALVPESTSLSEFASRLNEILFRDGIPNRFATLVYLVLKPHSGHLRFLNAGHTPLLILKGQNLERIDPASPILGAFHESSFVEQTIEIPADALLFIYSDGLTEAINKGREFFGEERLRALCMQCNGLTAEDAGRRLLQEVENFVGDEQQSDDISLVIIKRSENRE